MPDPTLDEAKCKKAQSSKLIRIKLLQIRSLMFHQELILKQVANSKIPLLDK